MELLKDYDFELSYHLGKVNVVADVLSRRSLTIAWMRIKEEELVDKFMDLKLDIGEVTGKAYVRSLRQDLLSETHNSGFSIHLGSTKMYSDLKRMFWWSGMKDSVGPSESENVFSAKIVKKHELAVEPVELVQVYSVLHEKK
ncbi:uncharacterized protein [Arachis hypogaea]|uniref:uncharacterized protein n=1 Tax=Arachis hypogaea TaxID=3818 RepID=UPI000DEC0BAD|nr:uncharacterized protein LOC112795011 [Arachis hypogaea]